MSRDDLIELHGEVTKLLGGGKMEIECENGAVVRGVLCGKMKKYRIRVLPGDRVKVAVSPYDTTHGLVRYRQR